MGRYPGKQFDKKRPGRGDDRPTMHDAVCDDCGNDCKVPFKPSTDKPIFCSRCFEKHDNKHSDRGNNEYRNSGGSRSSEMHDAVCDDCGNNCKVPFRPSGDKPIFCSSCFENRGNTHDKQRVTRERGGNTNEGGNVSNAQLEKINETLEKILKVLETKPEPKKKPKKKVIKKVEEVEEKPKKKTTVKKKVTKKKVVKKKASK